MLLIVIGQGKKLASYGQPYENWNEGKVMRKRLSFMSGS